MHDYVIVGAGSAGCVLANRLSADPSVKVLLLEAGPRDDYFWIRIPIGFYYCQMNPRVDWCYVSEPEPGLDGRRINVPRGKTLGGSSSINGMAYIRGHASDYDGWRDLGNKGWGWSDVLPYFRRSESYMHGSDELHGAEGELHVEDHRVRWPVLDDFMKAAAETGHAGCTDFNRGTAEGCGYFQNTQRRGVRWSAADAFLKPVLNRPNLEVVTGAQVKRILFEGARASGVEYWRAGELRSCGARAEVILSAGVIGTPQILQLSGVGAGPLLIEHGIPVRHHLPGVGENLHDHPNVKVVKQLKGADTLNGRYWNLFARAWLALEYALYRRGPLTAGAPPLTGFMKSDPSRKVLNVQLAAAPLSFDRLGEPLHRFPGFTAAMCNLAPRSRGHVRIKSADPRAAPAILHNYLVDPDDQQVALDSIRLLEAIFAAPAFAKYEPEPYMPKRDVDLLAYARSIASTVYHQGGTGAMGSHELAVVDERLRV
jgi:choline dehydrogenase